MNELTVVIPTYNEFRTIRDNIAALRRQLSEDGLSVDIVLVDDGSRDANWGILRELVGAHPEIRAFRLSRNFGKEAALFAGIAQVCTPLCLVMDSDMQHPPRYIKAMLGKMRESNADIVDGVKASRGRESWLSKTLAKGFYRAYFIASGVTLDRSSDFKLFNRRVMDALGEFREGAVFFRGIMEWSGFQRVEFPFDVDEREGDVRRFSRWRLVRFAVQALISYSSKPLYLPFLFSLMFSIGSLALGSIAFYGWLAGTAISGFTTVILLLLLMGSAILFSLGVMGIYFSRMYAEVKRRPRFLIAERAVNAGKGNGVGEGGIR